MSKTDQDKFDFLFEVHRKADEMATDYGCGIPDIMAAYLASLATWAKKLGFNEQQYAAMLEQNIDIYAKQMEMTK